MPRRWPALAWSVAAFGLYGATSARGPMWADSAKLTVYALASYLPSLNPGDHPGWTLIARVWLALTGWLDPVRSLNLLSAAAGAAVVGLLFLTVLRRERDARAAHAAAAIALVAHPLWWASALTETYAPALAVSLGCVLAASAADRRARAGLAGLLAGLALAVHAFTLFLTAPALLRTPRKRWLAAGIGGVLGSSPVWLAVLGVPPDPLTGHLAGTSASWGWHVGSFLELSHVPGGVARLLVLILFALGPLGVAAVFLAHRGRRAGHERPTTAAILGLVALALMVSIYSPFRAHVMTSFLVVGGLALWPVRLARFGRVVHVALQTALYIAAPMAAHAVSFGDLGARHLPDRDNASYFLSPWKCFDNGPETYARALFAAAPERSVVLSDFNPGAVLRLVQLRAGLRPDVEVVPTAVDDANLARDPVSDLAARIRAGLESRRPVVLADSWEPYYHPNELRRLGFELTPCGPGLLASAPAGAVGVPTAAAASGLPSLRAWGGGPLTTGSASGR